MSSKFYLIVNPHSGRGHGFKVQKAVERLLKAAETEFEGAVSEYSGHESLLVKKALEQGFKNFICIGGDGTLNEIINGIFHQSNLHSSMVTIGMIPSGTGNDWCRHHGIPESVEEAFEVIMKGNRMLHDAGKTVFGNGKTHYFINISGTGFEGFVAEKINRNRHPFLHGKFVYTLNIFRYLFQFKAPVLKITTEETVMEEEIFSAAVAICKFNGNGLMQAPDAVADDGMFDITLIKNASRFKLLTLLPQLKTGAFISHPLVKTFRTGSIEIKSASGSPVDNDGESTGNLPAAFTILPKAIGMYVP